MNKNQSLAFAQREAEEIRKLLKKTVENIITIGQKLIAVKARLKHGQWGEYLRGEFDWSERTAQNFMNVAERFKSENFADLKITPSALYLLAAPSTPEDVREAMLGRARGGERITVKDAQDAMNTARGALKTLREFSSQAADIHLEDLSDWQRQFIANAIRLPDELFKEVMALCNERIAELGGRRTLIIDPVFSAIMPRPTPEEYLSIENSILRNGVRVPLKVWRGILLDGHIRYDICHKHGIAFEVEEVNVADRIEALDYIWSIHIRSNYTRDQKAATALELAEYLEKEKMQAAMA